MMYGNPYQREQIALKRDVEAIRIPSGDKFTLYAGTELIITQALGGTFTVMTLQGVLSTVSGHDADALGKEVPSEIRQIEELIKQGKSIEDLARAQMRTCYDPEIPHNVLDLGLIYGCDIQPLEDGSSKIHVRMTLTAPGCGMGGWISEDIRHKLLLIPGVKEVRVEVVFDPPWDPSRMSPALRRELY
ncbi:MAG: putative Fe-S cluster assembly protein SufT [Candidatus Omnitrophota bacterium]|jgi:probable FeS assembly SUF system protein SufT